MDRTTKTPGENIDREERSLIALVKDKKVAFPARWVQEIIVFQRSQLLRLPFYDRTFLGVVHHHNQIIPLVSGRKIFLQETKKISQTTFTAVRLNEFGEQLTGVGVVVDRMVENIVANELSGEQLFQLTDVPAQIWQPQR